MTCNRWFRSAAGLAVHKCTPPVALRSRAQSPPPPIEHTTNRYAVPGMVCCFRHCAGCHRCFSSNPAALNTASLDLYATVDGDLDRLRTCIGTDVRSDVCWFHLLAPLFVPLYGAAWPVSGSWSSRSMSLCVCRGMGGGAVGGGGGGIGVVV